MYYLFWRQIKSIFAENLCIFLHFEKHVTGNFWWRAFWIIFTIGKLTVLALTVFFFKGGNIVNIVIRSLLTEDECSDFSCNAVPCAVWTLAQTPKYIQTSNLKLSFKDSETLLKFLLWINPFQWIRYSTYYERWKTNTYFVPSKVFFAVKKVPTDIELTISCKKDQICCFTISPFVWCVFYWNCSRNLAKDPGGYWSGANRASSFGG